MQALAGIRAPAMGYDAIDNEQRSGGPMTTKAKSEAPLRMIDQSIIVLNPANPRTDIGDLSELEASIRSHGVIQPITVRLVDGMYQVIAGSRRLAAAKRAGLAFIPCHVVDVDDEITVAIWQDFKDAFGIEEPEEVAQ